VLEHQHGVVPRPGGGREGGREGEADVNGGGTEGREGRGGGRGGGDVPFLLLPGDALGDELLLQLPGRGVGNQTCACVIERETGVLEEGRVNPSRSTQHQLLLACPYLGC